MATEFKRILNLDTKTTLDGSDYFMVDNATSGTKKTTIYDIVNAAVTASTYTRDVIDVKQLGAVGDGVADDTFAFQEAINRCCVAYDKSDSSTHYYTLWVPTGTYLITSPLVINGRMRLVGDGEETTLLYRPSSDDTTAISIDDIDTIAFKDFVIQKDGAALRTSAFSINPSGSYSTTVTHYVFDNVRIRTFNKYAVSSNYSYYGKFKDCRFENICNSTSSNGDGTTRACAFSGSLQQNFIDFDYCSFINNDTDVKIHYGYDINFNNCSFEGSGIYNDFTTRTDALHFVDVRGLSLNGTYIEGNYIDTGYATINLDGCWAANIAGGSMVSSYASVMHSDSIIRCTNSNRKTSIKNIYFEDPVTYFIKVDASSDPVTVDSCTFKRTSELTTWNAVSAYMSGSNKINYLSTTDNEVLPVKVTYVSDASDPIVVLQRGNGGQEWSIHNNNNNFVVADKTATTDILQLAKATTATSSVVSALTVTAHTTNTAAAGFGAGIDVYGSRAGSTDGLMGALKWSWTNATAGVENSILKVTFTKLGSTVVPTMLDASGNLTTSGSVIAPTGSFSLLAPTVSGSAPVVSGSAVKWLNVDVGGSIYKLPLYQ